MAGAQTTSDSIVHTVVAKMRISVENVLRNQGEGEQGANAKVAK